MSRTQTKPKVLTAKNFDDAITSHHIVLVDFWATWCAPCKSMAPDLEEVARQSEPDVLIAKVDVDKERALAERFAIKSMPTILTFHDGELHSSYVGAVPASGLWAAIEAARKPRRKGILGSLLGR